MRRGGELLIMGGLKPSLIFFRQSLDKCWVPFDYFGLEEG